MNIGFIGLGHMGLPMAGRLAASGASLTVWNRTPGKAAPLVAAGATLAGSPRDLAAGRDVVITMLADAAAVRSVLAGDGGVLAACRDGAVVIDMSTIGPRAARELAAEAARHGVDFLDVPVSGSTALAAAGTLTALAGGSPAAFERVRPVLAELSQRQLYLGPAGSGAAMKLAVNIIIAATNQAVAEALALAGESGIDRARAYEALTASAVASPFISYKREAFLRPGEGPVSFTTALMKKDLELALEVAGQVPLPVTRAAMDFLGTACEAGLAGAVFAAVIQVLRPAP
jgi:3-hydroxyisobutyrate dehydrogenase/2-hydroxy-3-oxopropionate reductase